MKKNYTLIVLLLISTLINAQITLTSATNTPAIGDSYTNVSIPNYTFDVSQSGANQTWDFSTASGTTETTNVINLFSSSEPLTFPSANLVFKSLGTNAESYISSSGSGISIEGNYLEGVTRDVYTDKQEFLKFPITYNDVFYETFAGTVDNIAASQTYDRSGTIEITADGYGNLILPYTTINNVLRIKVIIKSTDVFMGFTLPETTIISYFWYNTLNKFALANTSNVYYMGSLISSQAYHLRESDLVLGTKNLSLVDNNIDVYPNPSKDIVYIKNNSNNNLNIDVLDITGSFIKTVTISNGQNRIDVSDLQSGIYLLKYLKESQIYTKKLVVK